MTARTTALAVLALVIVGCGGARRSLDASESEPRCQARRSPAELRFACGEARLDPTLARNAELLAELVSGLRARPAVRRVILSATVSASAVLERRHPDLAAQRARSVADALAREGVPSAMIDVVEEPAADTAAFNEPDPCPPAGEDSEGDRRRAVLIDLLVCEP